MIPKEPYTTVRIHNTNTDRLIIVKVPVKDDKFNPIGNYSISGVPGTGSRIALDFSDSIGTLGKGLLPTGKPKDILDVPDFGKITVSIVDAANPVLFVRASDINKNCTESIDMIKADTEFLDLSEMIRGTAATLLGLVDNPQDAREKSPFLPFFVYVAPPVEYITMFGAKILKDAYEIAARLIGFGAPHRAFPGTGAICTGAAAAISGTLVNEILRAGKKKKSLVIGHSSGTIKTESNIEVGSEGEIEKIFVGISRTARMIMDGVVHLK